MEDENLERTLGRAKRLFDGGDGNVDESSIGDWRKRSRAIVGYAVDEPAERALEDLKKGDKPRADDLAALELSIRAFRPATLIKDSKVPNLPKLHPEVPRAFPRWSGWGEGAERYLPAIGRIDAKGLLHGLPENKSRATGTGFLVAADLLLTNRHVLDQLSNGTRRLAPGMAHVNFCWEWGSNNDEAVIEIKDVRAWSESADLALLQLAEAREVPTLEISDRNLVEDERLSVIGYPAEKSERNPRFLDALFSDRFGYKRASPGEISSMTATKINHDATTLGGSSGSPVFAQSDGAVVGVHFSGVYLWANGAVPGPAAAEFVAKHRVG